MNSYFCKNPPCIYIVNDSRRKIYAVFLEGDEENIFELDPEVFGSACHTLERVKSRDFESWLSRCGFPSDKISKC